METAVVIRNAVIAAMASVIIPAIIYFVPKLYKRRKKEREDRALLEKKRDEAIAQMTSILENLSGDMRCLYEVQIPQLDVIEVTLRSLKGEKINGNVTDALQKIRDTKDKVNSRLTGKVGNETKGS